MKTKTIKAVLAKKFNAWMASIEDEAVRAAVKNNTIITGGCIASMLLKEPVNDYDIYFRNRETALVVANYYIARFEPGQRKGVPVSIYIDDKKTDRVALVVKSAGVASETETEVEYQYFESRPQNEAGEYVQAVMQDPADIETTAEETQELLDAEEEGKPPYRPVFLSTNAITLAGKVQLILRFFGEPSEIHANYDFVHATNYWQSWGGGELHLNQPALEALLARELRYVGSKYPICSLIRVRKFVKRNWTINAGQIVKMAMQIGDLDLTNPAVLQDQLTGVDVAYFAELISMVHAKDPEKVNSAYLIEIIDRLF